MILYLETIERQFYEQLQKLKRIIFLKQLFSAGQSVLILLLALYAIYLHNEMVELSTKIDGNIQLSELTRSIQIDRTIAITKMEGL